jgi:hypothetical protein
MTPEWRFGATAIVSSGRPTSCFSYYPTADAGLYNDAYYHYCGLAGTGTDPDYASHWTKDHLELGLDEQHAAAAVPPGGPLQLLKQ